MADVEEHEWEYEYDEHENEDFYITLDLSELPHHSGAGNGPNDQQRGVGGRRKILAQRRAKPANATGQDEDAEVDDPKNSSSSVGEVQISGLHTENPLIKFNGQLLSCKWTSTIGTDMFFVNPNPNINPSYEPLRTLPGVDLLGISSTKLIATPARFVPRNKVVDEMGLHAGTATDPMEIDTDQPPPTDFMSRFNAAKVKRGDQTKLVVMDTTDGPILVAQGMEETHVSSNHVNGAIPEEPSIPAEAIDDSVAEEASVPAESANGDNTEHSSVPIARDDDGAVGAASTPVVSVDIDTMEVPVAAKNKNGDATAEQGDREVIQLRQPSDPSLNT